MNYRKDINIFKEELQKLPTFWDGKASILELKEADFQWRQMEWWAFYFEFKVKQVLQNKFSFPGDRFENVSFDLKGTINWDLKASAIKTDNHKIILNDKIAMEESIKKEKFHGEIIALCDVEYNDINRTFQKWHSELKGGKSNYEIQREERTSVSRYRKTKAELIEIIIVVFKEEDLEDLPLMNQGRNSNGEPRKSKYILDLELIDNYENHIIKIR
jgi:hypothetical protein